MLILTHNALQYHTIHIFHNNTNIKDWDNLLWWLNLTLREKPFSIG